MPPPRAALSTPSAKRRSSVRARPGMPRTTWACSVVRSTQLDAGRRVLHGAGAGARRERRGVGAVERAGPLEGLRDQAYDLVVVDVAGGGDDQVSSGS